MAQITSMEIGPNGYSVKSATVRGASLPRLLPRSMHWR